MNNRYFTTLLAFIFCSLVYICLQTTQTNSFIYTIRNFERSAIFIQKELIRYHNHTSLEKISKYNLIKQESRNEPFPFEKPDTISTKSPEIIDEYLKDNSDEWLNRSNAAEYSDYGDQNCKKNRDRIYFSKLIRKWKRIAQKLRIRYFLSSGSLLGAWRNEDVIPHDQDIDIHVHIDDIVKLIPYKEQRLRWDIYGDYKFHLYVTRDWEIPYNLRRKFSCSGKEVPKYEGSCSFTNPYARLIYRQWHLDLFGFTYYHRTLKLIPDNNEYFKEDFLPTVKCKFMGIETRCPRNPIKYLSSTYSYLTPKEICRNGTWVDAKKKKQ